MSFEKVFFESECALTINAKKSHHDSLIFFLEYLRTVHMRMAGPANRADFMSRKAIPTISWET